MDESVAETTRHSLEELSSVAATAPAAPTGNPLEEMVREMLRPILKDWVDEHLPNIVNDHVKREISRITGRKL
jgi:cell pole-organizing protein PopZ